MFHSITGFLKNNGDISYRVPQKAILKGVKTNKLKIIQGLNTKIQPLNRIELYRRVLKLNINHNILPDNSHVFHNVYAKVHVLYGFPAFPGILHTAS